jgi:Tfp pilus assembly protein PilW
VTGRRGSAGFTLIELMISSSVALFVVAALISASIALQKCFSAQDDYAVGKCDQLRLGDFLALDLRRALTVTPGAANSSTLLTLTIPDYYDGSGQPRVPTIAGSTVNYSNTPLTVTYSKSGASIFRTEGTAPATEIAGNVTDFQVTVQDLEKVVKTQITFAPRFSAKATTATRNATSVYNTTLLRNKRRDRS